MGAFSGVSYGERKAAEIFHCWQRCVRRVYLLGTDPLTGKRHDQWIKPTEQQIEALVGD